jgi:hypothetical protein
MAPSRKVLLLSPSYALFGLQLARARWLHGAGTESCGRESAGFDLLVTLSSCHLAYILVSLVVLRIFAPMCL